MSWRKNIEPLLRPLFQVWWRFERGTTLGVRVIARREDGCIALVKHTYVSGWHLPGGGVDSGESAPLAAIRELEEEVGLRAESDPVLLSVHSNHAIFKGDHVLMFEVTRFSQVETDNAAEIEEIGWFDPARPPEEATPATRRRLSEYLAGQGFALEW